MACPFLLFRSDSYSGSRVAGMEGSRFSRSAKSASIVDAASRSSFRHRLSSPRTTLLESGGGLPCLAEDRLQLIQVDHGLQELVLRLLLAGGREGSLFLGCGQLLGIGYASAVEALVQPLKRPVDFGNQSLECPAPGGELLVPLLKPF